MRTLKTIYLDNQATTPVHKRVLKQMLPFFGESFGNPHSTDHSIGWESLHAVEKAKSQIAQLIGADTDEIYFTSGATEANNMALLGLARKIDTSSKRTRFIMSGIEHKCVLEVGRVISHRFGFPVDYLPVDNLGRVSLTKLDDLMGRDMFAVSIMAVNNEIGTIQNIEQISEIVRKSGAIFHCDAAQAPISMDLQDISEHVDLLSLSSHKMYGPKGIGALYISRELQDRLEPLIYGGGQQNGLRSGTLPTPLCVGMGSAAELFTSIEMRQSREVLRQRTDRFIKKIMGLPWSITFE